MVDLQAYPIRHVFTTVLASVVVPFHDLQPKFFRHLLALILAVVAIQVGFKTYCPKLPISFQQPVHIYPNCPFGHADLIRRPDVILLSVSSAIAIQFKLKFMFVVYSDPELFLPMFPKNRLPDLAF